MARKIKSRAFQRKDSYFGMYGVSRKAIKKKRDEAKNNLTKKQKEEKSTVEDFLKEYELFVKTMVSND